MEVTPVVVAGTGMLHGRESSADELRCSLAEEKPPLSSAVETEGGDHRRNPTPLPQLLRRTRETEKEDRSDCVHAREDHRPAADSSRQTTSKRGRFRPRAVVDERRGASVSPSLTTGSLFVRFVQRSRNGEDEGDGRRGPPPMFTIVDVAWGSDEERRKMGVRCRY
nr:hypothetical protein Iba_chr12cCG12870 [Ipomoea batatas]